MFVIPPEIALILREKEVTMSMSILIALIVLVAGLLAYLIFINLKDKAELERELDDFHEKARPKEEHI